jgi:hypothetical protein
VTTRDLALLATLSLFCAGFAWSWGYVILGSVFFALGVVAALGIAQKRWRKCAAPSAATSQPSAKPKKQSLLHGRRLAAARQ